MNKPTSQSDFDFMAKLARAGHKYSWGVSEYDEKTPELTIYGDLNEDVKGDFDLMVHNGMIQSNVDIGERSIGFLSDDPESVSGINIDNKMIKAGNIFFHGSSNGKGIDGSGTVAVDCDIDAEGAKIWGDGLLIDAAKVDIFNFEGKVKIIANEVNARCFDGASDVENEDNIPTIIAEKISFQNSAQGQGKFIATKSITFNNHYGDGLQLFSLGEIAAFLPHISRSMKEMSFSFAKDISKMSLSDSEKMETATSYRHMSMYTAFDVVEGLKNPKQLIMCGINARDEDRLRDKGVSDEIVKQHGIVRLSIKNQDFIREALELIRKEFDVSNSEPYQDLMREINVSLAKRSGLKNYLK